MSRMIGHRDSRRDGWHWPENQEDSGSGLASGWLSRLSIARRRRNRRSETEMNSSMNDVRRPRASWTQSVREKLPFAGRGGWLAWPAAAISLAAILVAAFTILALTGSGSAHAGSGSDGPLQVVKRCSPEAAVGQPVIYIVDITNTSGSETLSVDTVNDPLLGGDITSRFADTTLDPGETTSSGSILRFVQEADPRPLVNTVTVDATYVPTGASLTAQASCTVDVPHLTLTKTAVFVNGTTIFTFVITNDGSVPLHEASAIDTVLGDLTSEFPLNLAVGESVEIVIERAGQECNNTITVIYQSIPRAIRVDAEAKCTPDGELGSIKITKVFEVGPFTGPTQVCFEISPPAGIDPAEQCATSFDPGPGAGEVNVMFLWRELPFDTYTITETLVEPALAYDPIAPIIVQIDGTNPNVEVPAIRNPLRPGTLQVEKRAADGNLWSTPAVTFHVCRDSLADCVPATGSFIQSIVVGNGNPNPSNPIVLSEDSYTVCEVVPAGFTPDPSRCQTVQVFAGDTNPAGQSAPGFVSFRNVPLNGAQLTPTGTTCRDFRDDTGADQDAILYDVRNGKISNAVPGVFFYFTEVTIASTVGTADQVAIDQSSSIGAWKEFEIKFVRVWDPKTPPDDCAKLFTVDACAGQTDCTFDLGSTGTFIVQVQYVSKSIKGSSPITCVSGTPTSVSVYTWTTKVDGAQVQSDLLDVKPKPGATC